MSKVKIQGNASGSGVFTLTTPNTSTDRTITLPDASGTLAFTTDDDDKLPLAGGTMTGTTSHGDNIVSKWGTSGDLEINHDGAHSNIVDSGTGDLRIRADNLRLSRSSDAELYLYATTDAGVQIYHNGSEKIKTTATGVTVTGDINLGADGIIKSTSGYMQVSAEDSLYLNYDTDNGGSENLVIRKGTTERLRVSNAGHVSIGGVDPDAYLSNGNDLVVYSTGTTGITIATNNTSAEIGLCFADSNSGDARGQGQIVYQHATDQMRFTIGGNTYPMSLKYGTGGVRINTSTYAGRNYGGDTFDITFSALPTRTGNSWSVINFVLVYSGIGGGAEGPVNSMALIELRGLSAWNGISRVNISSGHSTVAAIQSSSTTGCVVRISGMASNSAGHYQIQTVGGENTAVSLGF